MRRLLRIGGIAALVAGWTAAAPAQPATTAGLIEAARRETGAPGMAAAVWRDGRIVARLAAGERVRGSGVPVRAEDPFHLGSITKPFTATLAARLVERGTLSWDDTIGDWLGPAIRVRAEYRDVTLAELLSHRGGLSASPHPNEVARLAGVHDPAEQHLAVAGLMLALPPAAVPRRTYLYSNFSYVVAAAIIERATGRPYEALLREEVLAPLGLASAGFGAPGSGGRVIDAPWGHDGRGPIRPDSVRADNSPFLRPAGGLHMSMADLARFGADQLLGERGRGRLLTAASYRFLHAPATADRGMWGIGRGGEIFHDGTNLRWFALLRVIPAERLVIAIAANSAGDEDRTRRAFWALSEELRRRLR